MSRIDTLLYSNVQMQGVQRRQWLHQHSPQHLQHSAALVVHALHQREATTSQSTLVLGAGACTEVPLVDLARASDEVVLADLDLPSMQQARDELTSGLRKQIRLLKDDISGGVSQNLARLLEQQNWPQLASQGARAVFDAAALCLEQCPVPDPPRLPELAPADFGLVVSSLVLTQLFSYPILDVLDTIQRIAPSLLNEQERHHRYQDAAQDFRIRIINVHLHLLRTLLDTGGVAVLLSDMRGFVFNVHGTDHDATHRRAIPLVPRAFPDLIHDNFTITEEAHWEWLTDLPSKERPGRGYEVVGYVLKPLITPQLV
jgi:hypothetical protein